MYGNELENKIIILSKVRVSFMDKNMSKSLQKWKKKKIRVFVKKQRGNVDSCTTRVFSIVWTLL